MSLRPTIRLRLTAWYAVIFLASGTVMLGLSYFVVREEFEPRVERVELPGGRGAGVIERRVEPDGDGGVVTPAERPAEVERRVREDERRRDEEALGNVLGRFAAVLGLLTVGSVGIGWLVAGRALAPMSRITETARRVSGQSLHERIALDGPSDELKELADTFDAMLARLDTTFESHRRFVANASHELRTPLAIIRAELEELGETGPLGVDQQAMLANARRAVSRSERLIASLLTLARSEGELDRRTSVDMACLVRQALKAERCARAHGVEISASLSPAEVSGDPILLESLVVNLIENGLRYNRADGQLQVTTRLDGEAELVVTNTGPVLDADSVDRLFDAFARGDRSRATGDGAFGLGLSIVRAVAKAHGGRVAAVPDEGGGLTVTVRFPVSSPATGQPSLGNS